MTTTVDHTSGPIDQGISPNAMRLLWAGFMAILAAGIGFAIRGAIFATWGKEFGFTGAQLGLLGGAGFTGFCVGIITGGLVVDKIGYGKLVAAAFALHILSAFVTFGATAGQAQMTAYQYLLWGMFIFAGANGVLEAVSNPLVATLFPNNRTHYLNILHASWPAGMVIGALFSTATSAHLSWKLQLSLYLVPTVIYGIMFMGQKFPKSEASQKGLSLGESMKDVGILGGAVACVLIGFFCKTQLAEMLSFLTGSPFFTTPAWGYISWGIAAALLAGIAVITGFSMGSLLLFVLFLTHALVGAVELGTDQWIQNITGNFLTPKQGTILFVFTSMMMLALRFCGHFIEKKIGLSPVGILFTCAVLACLGLNLVAGITAFGGALLALTIYGIGKTFFWPTMLAVASDRFPRTGAVAISIMGGIGMMSAGLIGSPGLGYLKDRYAGEELQKANPAAYAEYKSETSSKFLGLESTATVGLDGKKLGTVKEVAADKRDATQQAVIAADQQGDRHTLRSDSLIPATMAVIYLALMIYFKSIGGYRPITIDDRKDGKSASERELAAA